MKLGMKKPAADPAPPPPAEDDFDELYSEVAAPAPAPAAAEAVSYTHLTLPTILLV